ncbi:MAG: class I SAM-dependent methyltransferase [Desulfobulbus sp.]|nr:class I SAM-dependent methyltransferase [Desulfobulbus sp.]
MADNQSKWLSEELAKLFSDGVRGLIPTASLQLQIINELLSAWGGEPKKILDLGCGDGILGRMLLDRFPSALVTFVDFSEPMLAKVIEKTGKSENIQVIKADFTTSSWMQHLEENNLFDLIVSGFAIHHQVDERKKEIYTEIFNLLETNGVFLNLDQVKSGTDSIGKIFDNYFLAHVRNSLSELEQHNMMEQIVKSYYEDKKENKPAMVEDQCQWLRDIGFQEVDCFFKTFEMAIFGGKKF